jgi:hypothetical protein
MFIASIGCGLMLVEINAQNTPGLTLGSAAYFRCASTDEAQNLERDWRDASDGEGSCLGMCAYY